MIELLLSDSPLPVQQDLPDVTARLGTGEFKHSVLSMLSRDPADRPTVAGLIETWNTLYPQPGVVPVGGARSSVSGDPSNKGASASAGATPPGTDAETSERSR